MQGEPQLEIPNQEQVQHVTPQPVPVNVQVSSVNDLLTFAIESPTGVFVFFLPKTSGPALRAAIEKYESPIVIPQVEVPPGIVVPKG